ncbi:MAG: MBL fold metallo-hydrolase, partial [Nannocystaceae bacterium]|nr:MBL fold metallo-hydrolase [Nannocystaceae bacterium]
MNDWRAWAYTVAPGSASFYLSKVQLECLNSYLDSPVEHFEAANDEALAGGMFVNVAPGQAAEVRALRERMLVEHAEQIRFVHALQAFEAALGADARGLSLEPWYARLPAPLRGRVELTYDYMNRPSVRLLEGMLYRSPCYTENLQSLRICHLDADADRPFFLTTPRLLSPGELDHRAPFRSSTSRALWTLTHTPAPMRQIEQMTGLKAPALASMLTDEPPRVESPWREKSMRIRYFGHATILAEWKGGAVLTDPVIGVHPRSGGAPRLSYSDLPEHIDVAVITHIHQDHFDLETLLRLRDRIGTLVVPRGTSLLHGDPSLRLLARQLGFGNVVELGELESLPLADGELIGVPFLGEHGDLGLGKLSYLICSPEQNVLVAADCDCLDPEIYHRVRQLTGPVDTVFIGTESGGAPLSWTNGAFYAAPIPRAIDQSRRAHGASAAHALGLSQILGAKRIYNYALGREPW